MESCVENRNFTKGGSIMKEIYELVVNSLRISPSDRADLLRIFDYLEIDSSGEELEAAIKFVKEVLAQEHITAFRMEF
jgi:hypothetical protein